MAQASGVDTSGRIPFRVRIGVVGHRALADEERLAAVVREQVAAIRDGSLGVPRGPTPVALGVVSALAVGADRLVVREVFAEARSRSEEARLDAVLPMDREDYAVDQQFDGDELAEYRGLLAEATSVSELTPAKDARRYRHAGQAIVDSCDVLVALWDGRPSRGEGGTAETLLYAAARWRPCIWISTDGRYDIGHNLGERAAQHFLDDVRDRAGVAHERAQLGVPDDLPPLRVLGTLAETYDHLDRFNAETLPKDFVPQLRRELSEPGIDVGWVAAAYLRATLVASRYQRLFDLASWTMAALATAIGVALAIPIALSVGPEALWAWLKLGLASALVLVFVESHSRRELHNRWLSYRLLAERLRSARYVSATGVNYSRLAGLRGVFVEQQSANWVQRAFEEVWDSRPGVRTAQPLTERGVETIKTWLADDWILRQIEYHREAAERHRRSEVGLRALVTGLFGLTLTAVVARAISDTFDLPHVVNKAATFCAIVLPAAGGSLSAILTVRQHRALAERYRRMDAELSAIRLQVLDADEDSLPQASSDAARVIAEESGDWFGAMWFLDIEHPP